MGCEDRRSLEDEHKVEDLRLWASFRGQTLSRTGSVFIPLFFGYAFNYKSLCDHCNHIFNS